MSRPTPGGSGGGPVMVDVSEELIGSLKQNAVTLRMHIIRLTHNAQSGHPGGSMSAGDIVTALYFPQLRVAWRPRLTVSSHLGNRTQGGGSRGEMTRP